MFEAGAIAFHLQMVGAQVFQNDGKASEQVVKQLGTTAEQAAPKLQKPGAALDKTATSAKNAKAPLDGAAKSTKQVGDESDKATPKVKLTAAQIEALAAKSNAAKTTIGTAFLGIGAAIGAMAVLAVSRFANFDQGMSNLAATTHDTAEEQKELAAAALDAGAKTTFTAREAADAQNELAKAGLNVHEILTGGLNGSLALAAAGELGVARAGEIAATTLQQFQLDGGKAGHVADVLAAGANKAIGSVDDLANGLKFVGPVANAMNISLEQTVGTLALFAAQGVVGEQGGTALRGVLSSLTSPSAQANAELKRLNVTLYDGQGKFLGLSNLAGQLGKAYQGATDQQKDFSLGVIFGNEQITAARLLMQAGADGVDEYTDAVNDAGYAAELASEKQNNLAGDIEKLGGSLDTALVVTGANANGVLRDMVQQLTGLVDWYSSLDPVAQSTGLVIAGTTAAVLLLGGTVLIAIPKVVAFREAVGTIATTMPRTTAAVKGFSSLLAGPWGFAVLAALELLNLWMQHEADVNDEADQLSTTLDQQTGAITDNTREAVANRLAKDGVYEAAAKMGISEKDLTDAIFGEGSAIDSVKGKVADYTLNHGAADAILNAFGTSTVNKVTDAVGREQEGLDRASQSTKAKAAAMNGAADASDNAAASADTAADSYEVLAEQVDGVVTSLKDLADELDAANGKKLDARAAARKLKESYDDYDAAIKRNGKSLNDSKTDFDTSTNAGRENQAAMDDMAKSALDSGQAIIDAGGSYEQYQKVLTDGRTHILKEIEDLGITGDKADRLAEKILHIPSKTEWKIYADVHGAQEQINNFLGKNTGHVITFNTSTTRVTSDYANGGIREAVNTVKHYANGGTEYHAAQIAHAGAMRVWAEPETGGEAYIPLGQAKRGSALPILDEVASRFGYQLVPADATTYAAGGIPGAPSSSARGGSGVSVKVINKTGVSSLDDLIELRIQQHGMWQQIHLGSGGNA